MTEERTVGQPNRTVGYQEVSEVVLRLPLPDYVLCYLSWLGEVTLCKHVAVIKPFPEKTLYLSFKLGRFGNPGEVSSVPVLSNNRQRWIVLDAELNGNPPVVADADYIGDYVPPAHISDAAGWFEIDKDYQLIGTIDENAATLEIYEYGNGEPVKVIHILDRPMRPESLEEEVLTMVHTLMEVSMDRLSEVSVQAPDVVFAWPDD